MREKNLIHKLRIANECFELENKSNRTLKKLIALVEYCLEKYGFKN